MDAKGTLQGGLSSAALKQLSLKTLEQVNGYRKKSKNYLYSPKILVELSGMTYEGLADLNGKVDW